MSSTALLSTATMPELRIRKAEASDIRLIQDMAEIAFRQTYRDILSSEQMEYMMDWMYSRESLSEQMSLGHVFYIAYSGDKACGYASIVAETNEGQGTSLFHLQKLYVLPSDQAKGVGSKLFERIKEHTREASRSGKIRIELNVNRNNPAVGFYKHLGLEILREGDFPIGHGFYMNDYIMGMELTV